MAEVRVLWSNRSITDLEEIVSYISHDSPPVARNLAGKIIEAVTVLEKLPAIGGVVPGYNDTSIRELLYRNCRIVYQLSRNAATIVTVFHGSRPLEWNATRSVRSQPRPAQQSPRSGSVAQPLATLAQSPSRGLLGLRCRFRLQPTVAAAFGHRR